MPTGGQLAIETSELDVQASRAPRDGVPPGSYQLLSVHDTGEGMDAATLEHIFEPFFTTKGVGRGTGLGLPVVHGIVSQTGGHIRVESSVGGGTTFRLYFPATAAAGILEPALRESGHRAAPGAVALVVEDDPLVRSMTTRALAEAGYRVVEAGNGEEAMTAVRAGERLDVVVTDIGMPVMDGYALALGVQNVRPDLPVVFMTGYGDQDADRPGSVARNRLILKPFSPDVLVHTVGEVLSGKP
jgi:CheY-like chemotaxis protein